jgi:hypothetical protein
LANSFKDTNTGLVWMDFGVNNGISYNEVKGYVENEATLLGVDYSMWRLPTVEEVYSMWANLANLDGVDASDAVSYRFADGFLLSTM